jgi:thiol-disulfide isomerase/thioredoxin
MKKTFLLIILLLIGFLNVFAQKAHTSVTANDALNKAEQYVNHIKTIAYQSSYKQIDSGVDDSVSTANGQVWMQAAPTDSIFLAKFHIKGEIKDRGGYDCFYDGDNSFEITHQIKEIRVTNPRQFINNENNPAKARMAMVVFNYYYTDAHLKQTLLKNKPRLSMQVQPKQYAVKFDYPIDKLGMKETRVVYINKTSFAIERVTSSSTRNGTRVSSEANYTDIKLNDKTTLSQIPVTDAYKGYTVKERKPDVAEVTESPLIGKPAKYFAYNTFDNQKITLDGLKGKYVLLDFWESWCGHCIISIPAVRKLNETYGPKRLTVLSVTTENPSRIKELIKVNKLNYPALIADKKILNSYKVIGRPTYVLIDPAGKIIAWNEGDLDIITKQLGKVLN